MFQGCSIISQNGSTITDAQTKIEALIESAVTPLIRATITPEITYPIPASIIADCARIFPSDPDNAFSPNTSKIPAKLIAIATS